jgi:glycine/D-amino acid oxidase-like deaminating enzyme
MQKLRVGPPIWLVGQPVGSQFPMLRGAHEVDIAIVGGGITGAIIAVVLARAGVRVGLLEADLIGRGSTAASAALLLREPDLGLRDLAMRYGMARARRLWQLSLEATRTLVAMLRRVDCGLATPQAIYYTLEAAALPALRSEYAHRCRSGFAGTWLTPGALRRVAGITARGAISTPAAQCDPYRACVGLLQRAAGAGAAIFERSRVRRITQTRDGIRVITPRGSLSASHVVIATGYATAAFRPLAGRFQMKHTYVLATEPLTRRQAREVGLTNVMLWDTERPYHYARWTPDRRLLLGGADLPVTHGRGRARAFAIGTARLREYFEGLFPALAAVNIDYSWEGLFAKTPDGLPYIGPHRRYPRHLFALGYGGNGMTFGCLAAKVILEKLRGVRSGDHDLVAFGRV